MRIAVVRVEVAVAIQCECHRGVACMDRHVLDVDPRLYPKADGRVALVVYAERWVNACSIERRLPIAISEVTQPHRTAELVGEHVVVWPTSEPLGVLLKCRNNRSRQWHRSLPCICLGNLINV